MANKATCKVNDCNHEVIAKGYCRRHYRLWRHGQMPKPRYKICTTEKCRKPRFRGSLCQEHYAATHGNKPEATGGTPATPATPAVAPAAGAGA